MTYEEAVEVATVKAIQMFPEVAPMQVPPSDEGVEWIIEVRGMSTDQVLELQADSMGFYQWPVREKIIPLEGPEHEGASWSSEAEEPKPDGDETEGW